jgi:hypothetical protein
VIHQADLIVGVRVPRAIDFQRPARLPRVGGSQVGASAPVLALELAYRVERIGQTGER